MSTCGQGNTYDCTGILWLYPADDGKRWCQCLEEREFQLEYRTLIEDK